MKDILFILFFAISSYNSDGQLPDYYTYLVKGEATIIKAGVKAASLKQETFVFKTDIINLKAGAEVTLIDKEQNFFVLNSPGPHHAGELVKTNPDHIPGVTEKYLKLVWNEILNPNQDFTKLTNNNVAGVYGGVSRGDLCNNLIYPIKGLRTVEDSLQFKWHQTSPTSNYTFFIYNSEGKEVVNMIIKDTEKTLNIIRSLKAITGNYYCLIKAENAACEDEVPVYFELMSRENEQKLIASLVPPGTDTSKDLPTRLQLIDKLEKHTMIPAALKYYAELVDANPGNEALLKSYILFLLKYSFDKEANDRWQENVATNNNTKKL